MTETKTYKNAFTRDGKLHPQAGVSKTKVKAVQTLWEAAAQGDRVAEARLMESIATSDAALNAVYLINLQTFDQFDAAPRTWTQIAGTRELPDFRQAVLTGIFGGFEGLKRDGTATGNGKTNPAGIPPVVSEGETYPYATLGQVEASYGRLQKRGFKVGWTWEARVNDGIGFFDQVPGEMLNTALDAEEWEVYQALLATNSSRQLAAVAAGAAFDGVAVTVNAALSRRALIAAVQQLAARQVNGRNIQVNGGYNLIVPIGTALAAQLIVSGNLVQQLPGGASPVTGGYVVNVTDPSQQILNSITIIESQFVTGTNWYLIPKPGTVRRPVIELGRLRGETAPELRVNNLTGDYAGGGAVAPFQGSFDNDTIDMRLRYPITGILWADIYIVWSLGTGAVS